MKPEIPEVEPDVPQSAVSIYGQDGGAEDFPVLKAFQQYIDAEQEKARKRMLTLAVFFGLFTLCVVAVFVVLLMHVSERNQKLNDRLVEFAMQQKSLPPTPVQSSPVVVQPPQDSSAILALTAKLDEMQKKLAENQAKAERDAKEAAARAEKAAIEAAKPKGPSKEELEIQALKEQIKANERAEAERIARAREKAKLEKEAKRLAELEAYRRKNYPELYEKPVKAKTKRVVVREIVDDDEDEEEEEVVVPVRKESPSRSKSPSRVDEVLKELNKNAPPSKNDYSIPVEVKGSSSDREWSIPED